MPFRMLRRCNFGNIELDELPGGVFFLFRAFVPGYREIQQSLSVLTNLISKSVFFGRGYRRTRHSGILRRCNFGNSDFDEFLRRHFFCLASSFLVIEKFDENGRFCTEFQGFHVLRLLETYSTLRHAQVL